MKNLKKALSLFLVFGMLCGMLIVPASAAESDADLKVALYDANGVALKNNSIPVSDQVQTVRMAVTTSAEIDLCSIGYTAVAPEGWTVIGFDNEDPDITLYGAHYNLSAKTVVWNTAIMAGMEDIKTNDIGTIIVEVPANTPADDYTITMSMLSVTKTYGTVYIHNKVDVSATLTIFEQPGVLLEWQDAQIVVTISDLAENVAVFVAQYDADGKMRACNILDQTETIIPNSRTMTVYGFLLNRKTYAPVGQPLTCASPTLLI